MSTDIPKAREMLLEIAEKLDFTGISRSNASHEIKQIVSELMIRSFTGRKTPTKHRKMTDALASDVRAIAQQYPTFSHEEIARCLDINAGRVSEVLAGKRFVNGRAVRNDNPMEATNV